MVLKMNTTITMKRHACKPSAPVVYYIPMANS